MEFRSSLIPHSQTSVLMQPRESSLDHPPVNTQPATVGHAPFRQVRLNAPLPKLPTMGLGIVTTVAIHLIREAGEDDLASLSQVGLRQPKAATA